MLRFERFETGEVTLNVAMAGDPGKPLIVLLHGFPEYWAAWREVMEELADAFFVVAPDQRGYNLSSRPAGVDAYKVRNLVADIKALTDSLSPGKPFVLAGHDWGASVAYAFAFAHPQRLTRLVIANGIHPRCFQDAIHQDPGQREASQYINKLRDSASDVRLAEDGYRRMLRMVDAFSDTAWMTPALRQGYFDAWGQPGAIAAMLNWYRASPIDVPEPGEKAEQTWVQALPEETMRVRMPHLVLWGEADAALRPSCLTGLDRFCDDLTIRHVAGADHWILHQKPREVARLMRDFVGDGS